MKAKAEHTPGPIPVVADRGYVKLGNVTFSYSPYHYRGGELERMVALVKAAPGLLEELEDLQNKAAIVLNKQHDGRGVEPEDWSDLYAREQDARAILAKARGEEGQ